ncbi:CHASE2 domain-containing protein [Jiella mangrovi]|uniref:Adenylate/guanylate cyclase domain-containing protein n=1 Tax=Jiella mangrovi TaxID=2821407 RepID=A0ABS4BLZ4_9HYPH|nr:adenylate/guanylate cyclase domain-containing protein [Jiella mangrovi]MBP0617747.1 adenylate/guanylate cyclase domain-containing protein [Jiella mangrovi]
MISPRNRASGERRKGYVIWAVGLLTLLVGLSVSAFSPVTILDRLTVLVFDGYQRALPREQAGAPVVVVDIDEAAIAQFGQWPWPRTMLARMVDRLGALGAANIAFDMVFPEPDRTSLNRIVEELKRSGTELALPEALADLDNDRVLAEAFARNKVTAGIAISNETDGALGPPKAGFSFAGADPKSFLPPYRGGVTNIAPLDAAAAGIGFFSFPPGRDGIVRELPIVANAQGALYPALAAEALRLAQGAGSYIVRSTGASGEIDSGRAAMTALKDGGLEIPTGPLGTIWIYYSGMPDLPVMSAAALFDPQEEARLAAAIAGHIVLVGTSAVGLRDLVATPIAASMPGVMVHAEIIDQIMGETFLSRPDWAEGAETLTAFVLGVLLIVTVRRAGALISSAITVGLVVSALAISWIAFERARLLIDPVLPAITVATVFAVTMPLLLLITNREKLFVRDAFKRYLAPTLVERLADNPQALELGGEERELTVLFSDIRGFTALSENLTPSELTTLLNTILTPMTDILLRGEAMIDKYIGDAIMAFWNAPLEISDHRRKACLAALAMVEELGALNRGRDEPLRIGIGLNTGPCCVGNLGSTKRFSYSAIGDSVNVASRIEGLTKTYGVSILVSESVREGAEDLAFLPVDRVKVVGRAQPLPVYVLMGDAEHARDPAFLALSAAHSRMIRAYRAGDLAGLEAALAELTRLNVPELAKLHQIYRERYSELWESPPGDGWDGVTVAREK